MLTKQILHFCLRRFADQTREAVIAALLEAADELIQYEDPADAAGAKDRGGEIRVQALNN